MQGFTRQETLALTGTDSSRLAYLDRAKIVQPQKFGHSPKPTVIYQWEQLLEIRAIDSLKQKISSQTTKEVVQALSDTGFGTNPRHEHLVIVNDDIYWVNHDWSNMPEVMQKAENKNKDTGQFIVIVVPPLAKLLEAVWRSAADSDKVDFESFKLRAKTKPDTAT